MEEKEEFGGFMSRLQVPTSWGSVVCRLITFCVPAPLTSKQTQKLLAERELVAIKATNLRFAVLNCFIYLLKSLSRELDFIWGHVSVQCSFNPHAGEVERQDPWGFQAGLVQ